MLSYRYFAVPSRLSFIVEEPSSEGKIMATVPFSETMATYGKYRGGTHEGLRNGKGRYKFTNAFYEYDGEWVDGVMHGEGTLKMGDGGQYEGTFENGAMSGVGMRRWKDGATYSGQFAAGEVRSPHSCTHTHTATCRRKIG